LLHSIAEKAGIPLEEVYEKAVTPLEKEYGLYEGLEKASREGVEFLTKLGVPEGLSTAFAEVAKERIHVPTVKVKGVVELRCMKPEGVRIIKEAFSDAKKADKTRDAKIRAYVVAAPKYCIEVMAENYKRAEDILQKFAQDIISNVSKAGGQGTFRR
jgi:translation initiation factor 2 subunit 1